MCVHVLCVNMTLLFHGYIYSCFFKKYFLECLDTPLRNPTHTQNGVCVHTHLRMQTLAHTLNNMPSFLSDPYRAQCVCQPVAPPLLSISFFPGAPSHTPGAWGLHFPSPSSLSTNARIRFGKGSSFFVYSGQLVHSR